MAELVTVYALKDHVKKNIKHPEGGYAIGEDGSARWPYDNWTKRRIRDGDISLEAPAPPPEGDAQAQKGEQEQPAPTAAVRRTRATVEPKPTNPTEPTTEPQR